MASNRGSYAWALDFQRGDPELARLSDEGRDGLAWAWQLADNARERSYAALTGDVLPVRLTITKLARDEIYWTPAEIRQAIERAQVDLFGRPLSERALRYRLSTRQPGTPLADPRRACAEPDCDERVAAGSASHKRYCARHDQPAARVRRHRRNRHKTTATRAPDA